VVWSKTNENLMYPEDSYIKVISDKTNTRFIVPSKKYLEGTNYYRISAIFEGFDDDKRINSNVITLEKEPLES
jgi:hypothetical protein